MTKIREYLEAHRQEMTEFLSELVAVPSVQGRAEDGAPFGREPARALDIMLKSVRSSVLLWIMWITTQARQM